MINMKPKNLASIVASAVIAVAPLLSGCQYQKVPVYGPPDSDGNRQVIGHYRSSHLSLGLTLDTDKLKEKQPGYNPKLDNGYTPDTEPNSP